MQDRAQSWHLESNTSYTINVLLGNWYVATFRDGLFYRHSGLGESLGLQLNDYTQIREIVDETPRSD